MSKRLDRIAENFSLVTTLKKAAIKGVPGGMIFANAGLASMPGLDFSSKNAIYASVGGAILGFAFKVAKNVLKQKYGIDLV